MFTFVKIWLNFYCILAYLNCRILQSKESIIENSLLVSPRIAQLVLIPPRRESAHHEQVSFYLDISF